MKVAEIKIEGPRGWALIFRGGPIGSEVTINWELTTGERGSWVVSQGDWRGQGSWTWAGRLHQKLEGLQGCAGDLAPYRSALEHFFG